VTSHHLVNFNIPVDLKARFDSIIKQKGLNRTSTLINLIETYCRRELALMQEESKFATDTTGNRSSHKPIASTDYELPLSPFSDEGGSDVWHI